MRYFDIGDAHSVVEVRSWWDIPTMHFVRNITSGECSVRETLSGESNVRCYEFRLAAIWRSG
jgi:hypothetical protein